MLEPPSLPLPCLALTRCTCYPQQHQDCLWATHWTLQPQPQPLPEIKWTLHGTCLLTTAASDSRPPLSLSDCWSLVSEAIREGERHIFYLGQCSTSHESFCLFLWSSAWFKLWLPRHLFQRGIHFKDGYLSKMLPATLDKVPGHLPSGKLLCFRELDWFP